MYRRVLLTAVFLSAACYRLSASPVINGEFSIDGSITVSLNTITWTDNLSVADRYVVGPPNPSGSWAGMALGAEGTVQDLNLTSQPVGGSFPAFDFPDWMTFPGPGAQSTITITLQYIYAGVDGTAQCGAAPAPGQVCTPLAGNGQPGPFNLMNSASGTTSSASFTFLGTAHDSSGALGDSQIIGQYSSNFTVPYQTVLAELSADGSVTNTYAATFTAAPVPETSSLSLMLIGTGLCAVAGVFRRRRKTARS